MHLLRWVYECESEVNQVRHTAKLVSKYAVNWVIDLRDLKTKDILLYGVVKRNSKAVANSLKELGIELLVMEDVQGKDRLRMQLKLFIGEGMTLNLTKLRTHKRSLYSQMFDYGTPAEVATQLGFLPTYTYRGQRENELVTRLYEYADENMILTDLYNNSKSVYESAVYFAYCKNMSVRDYLLSKGFGMYKGGRKKSTLAPKDIYALRNRDNPPSWNELGAEAGVTFALVRKMYLRYAEEVDKVRGVANAQMAEATTDTATSTA